MIHTSTVSDEGSCLLGAGSDIGNRLLWADCPTRRVAQMRARQRTRNSSRSSERDEVGQHDDQQNSCEMDDDDGPRSLAPVHLRDEVGRPDVEEMPLRASRRR
jgi:hypothetical protein